MSFAIDLIINQSQSNVVSKDISTIETIQGVLRRGASVTDPLIEIQYDIYNGDNAIPNYLYIPVFKRYYYILGIRSTINGMWEISCHVDVLMSYQNEIRAQTAIVERQETAYNLMLDDGYFMTYQNPKIQIKTFSNATPFETQEFVLVIAGS